MFHRHVKTAYAALAVLLAGAASPALAQNAMQTNMRTDHVYDGVTYDQLLSLFSETVINDANPTIIEYKNADRPAYFSMSFPELPFAIFVGPVGEGYSGEGDGVYAGLALFTPINISQFTPADINSFNFDHKLVKFSAGQNQGIFSVEAIAAGGVTEQMIGTTLVPFFNGLTSLLNYAPSQNTISHKDDAAPKAVCSNWNCNVSFDAPMTASKISTASPDNINRDRVIAEFAERAARGE